MKSIFWLLLCTEIWSTIRAFEVELKTGLIFNAKFQSLDEINEDGEKFCPSCMVACPAKSEREVQIKEHVAVSKTSVFVSKTYGETEQAIDIEANVCEKSFKPSVIFDKKENTHEIGYELFYKDYGNNMNYVKYEDFKTITEKPIKISETVSITIINDMRKIKTKVGYVDKEKEVFNATMFKFPYGRNFVFYWASVLSFKFNPEKHQIRAYLKADIANEYNKKQKCSNYDLGYDLFTSKKNFYPFSSGTYGSVVQTPLAPSRFFHTKAAKLASCTRLNSVPVWKDVDERLKVIDAYLYAIYRHKKLNPRVDMFFGVSGVQTKNVYILDDEIDLSTNKTLEKENILMPEIIYRVVKYSMPLPPTIWTYYRIIIIHNERNGVTKDRRLCPELESSNFDTPWIDSGDDGIYSYACSASMKLFQKLGVYEERPVHSISDLTLFEVTLGRDEKGGPDNVNIKEDVENYAKELLKEGEE